jgi:hypothetical protein
VTSRRTAAFTAVRTEGALLPAELLHRIARLDPSLPDVDAASFKLGTDERIQDAIQRAWTRLRAAWAPFRTALNAAPPAEAATALTREKWLLPLFAELGFGRLAAARAVEKDGKSFPVSHGWGSHVALHLVGARVPLDVRTGGVPGAARTTPHGLVQELLNRSDDHLWAVVTNGLQLRLLRDNVSLTRQAFVEFDLAALFDGESYADFVVLFLLLHVSRFGEGRPDDCPLERWAAAAKTQGTRALDRLRDGVQDAITALGAGFLGEPRNVALKDRLRTGELPALDYYRQVLRLVYRLLFLFVAEDRDLLFAPDATEPVRERFPPLVLDRAPPPPRRPPRRHAPWRSLAPVPPRRRTSRQGRRRPGPRPSRARQLPLLASAAPDLDGAELPNRAFLEALRALTLVEENGVRRFVDWKNLGAEELGSVYESLLELHPEINAEAGKFELGSAGGNERKTTGSYYTPDSLIQCLLDSALDPVLAEAARATDPEAAILALKVCDPACGSGHFLIAAAHRIAKRLAAARTGDDEPPPESVRRALRDVIGRCLYGVDLNEMAVELCKVNLWMEALEPGRPLSFLDAKILHGNALLGTTPALIAKGVPDEAFEPITGDTKEVARALKRQNKSERSGQGELFGLFAAEPAAEYRAVESAAAAVATLPDASLASVRAKEARWRALRETPEYRHAALVADAWTAAFVWPKQNGAPHAPTHAVFEKLRAGEALPPATAAEVARITADYRFLHWHTAFPEVFRAPAPNAAPENPECGWSGGFDVVLGNPPWERVKLQEQEWFAVRSPEIASAPNAAARKRLIADLRANDPSLFAAFEADLRRAEGESHLIRSSDRFPLCGRGDVNTYAVFAETNRSLLSQRGRLGCIVPSGIATDDTTKHFFETLVRTLALTSFFEFENDGFFADAGQGHMVRFALVTLTGAPSPGGNRHVHVSWSQHGRTPNFESTLHALRRRPRAPEPEHANLPRLPLPPRCRDHQVDLPPRPRPRSRRPARTESMERLVLDDVPHVE